MELKEIKELIKAVDESSLTVFEYERDGESVYLSKEITGVETQVIQAAPKPQQVLQAAPVIAEVANIVNDVSGAKVAEEGDYITSPIVGTFYSSPSPNSDDFVKVGDKVSKGQVLCIIEAMKLMNEIEADRDGEIVEILVSNEELVEFGQKIFKVK